MPQGTLDRETLEAVGVLARAVERERVPGVLECRLLANALKRTLDSGRERELTEASRIFRTLDVDLRERIVARARVEAQQARAQAKGAATPDTAINREEITQEIPALPARRVSEPKARAGTNFLAALNGLRPAATTGGSSRGAARDRLRAAVIHEVTNTFGQRHAYLIPAAPGADGLVRQRCDKRFYVSPFMDMETAYHFRIRPPRGEAGEPLAVSIRQTDAGGPVLHASLTARRVELTDGAILRAWARHPLMTAKVVAGIHWEALHLWRKGLAIRPRPPAPVDPVTVVKNIVVTDRFREGHS